MVIYIKKPDAPLSHVASDFNCFIKSLSELIAQREQNLMAV